MSSFSFLLLLLGFSCHILPRVADANGDLVADDADDEAGAADESVADVAVDGHDSHVTTSLITIIYSIIISNSITIRIANLTLVIKPARLCGMARFCHS